MFEGSPRRTVQAGDPTQELFEDTLTPPVAWPIAVAVALAVVVLLEVIYRYLFRWLQRMAGASKTQLDDVLVKRMRLPAQVLVILAGGNVLFALRGIENATLSKGVTLVELLLVAYLVIEIFETAVVDFWLGEKRQVRVPNVIRGLGLLVLYTAAVLSILGSVTGLNLAPVLATSTVLTVVVGLALQDVLGNMFAGLALSFEKPFEIGDWILVDNVEGRVKTMGWRAVHLQTFSDDVVTLPNAVIAKALVHNFCRPDAGTSRRVEVLVNPLAPPDEVERCAQAAFAQVPAIRADRARVWLVQVTLFAHRYELLAYMESFTLHDDLESDLRKAFVTEALARGIAPSVPAAAAAA